MKKVEGSGRKKGTPNKRSLDFVDILDQSGINPLQVIINEMSNLNGHDKIRICFELLPYIFPKRKAIDQSLQILDIIETTKVPENLEERIKEIVKNLEEEY